MSYSPNSFIEINVYLFIFLSFYLFIFLSLSLIIGSLSD